MSLLAERALMNALSGKANLLYEKGEFQLDEDTTSYIQLDHHLGHIPKYYMVWADARDPIFVNGDFVKMQVRTFNGNDYGIASQYDQQYMTRKTNDDYSVVVSNYAGAYANGINSRITDTKFAFAANGKTMKANVTWHYCLLWWEDSVI